jgi:hypothetical protein
LDIRLHCLFFITTIFDTKTKVDDDSSDGCSDHGGVDYDYDVLMVIMTAVVVIITVW